MRFSLTVGSPVLVPDPEQAGRGRWRWKRPSIARAARDRGGPLRCLPSQEGGKGQSEKAIFESVRLRSAIQNDAATETRPQRRPALTQPLQVARVHAVSGPDLHTHHHAPYFDQDIHLAAVVRAPEEKRGDARLAAPCPQVVHHPRLDYGAALLRRFDRLAIPQSRQCRRYASVAPVEFWGLDKSFAEIGAVWR